MRIDKYYVYSGFEPFDGIDFDDLNDAIDHGKENDLIHFEVERHTWDDEESYHNYEPADRFRTMYEQ